MCFIKKTQVQLINRNLSSIYDFFPYFYIVYFNFHESDHIIHFSLGRTFENPGISSTKRAEVGAGFLNGFRVN